MITGTTGIATVVAITRVTGGGKPCRRGGSAAADSRCRGPVPHAVVRCGYRAGSMRSAESSGAEALFESAVRANESPRPGAGTNDSKPIPRYFAMSFS